MTIRIDLKLAIEEFEQFGFYMARRLFAADEMQALLKFARGDSQLAQEAYVRKDASGGQSKLALRNDLDDRSPYTAIVPVDRATQANGCLQVLRGSHRIGRIEHFTTGDQKGADAARVAQAIQRHELVFCEMEPGDALFFHGNLLHSSSKNLSHQPRWSLICCYNTKHNDPYITDGRHPNYSRLEIWEDDRVHQELLKQL